MKWMVMAVVALVSTMGGRAAQGQGDPGHLGEAHQLVISADRLFGYVHASNTITLGGVDMTTSSDNVSIFSNPFGPSASSYTFPRLACDGFVINGLSIGGAVSYFWTSIMPAGSTTNTSVSGYLIAPRIGYAIPFSPASAIWPRAGFTYLHASTQAIDQNGYAFTIEVPLAIILGPHLAILGGPTVDLGLGGSRQSNGVTVDSTGTDVGVQFGFAGYL